MTNDAFFDHAPLFALGALDAAQRAAFQAHAASCPQCRLEVLSFDEVANQIPLALDEVQPKAEVRGRLLGAAKRATLSAVEPDEPTRPSPTPRPSWTWALPVAASIALAAAYGVERSRGAQARAEAVTLARNLGDANTRLAALEATAREEASFRQLVSDPRARIANLDGLNQATVARARVVFRPQSKEAVLLVAGLPTAPAGKSYQAWVIAGAAPVSAGTFEVGADGSVVFHLPAVDTTQVHTFAVTVEPKGGVPAPTGPMVLAGKAT